MNGIGVCMNQIPSKAMLLNRFKDKTFERKKSPINAKGKRINVHLMKINSSVNEKYFLIAK